MIRRIIFIIILCCIFLTYGVFAESLSCTGDTCDDNQQSAAKQFSAGERYYSSGRYTDALAAYMTASELDYQRCYCDKKIVELYIRLNQPNQALSWSRSAFTGCGDQDKTLWKLQGDAYSYLGRNDEAVAAYDKALEIDSGYADALTQKNYIMAVTSTPEPVSTYTTISSKTVASKASSTGGLFNGNLIPDLSGSPGIALLISLAGGIGVVYLLNKTLPKT